MIENVKLLNFLSHSDTSITLPQGISVFVGRNGAGKSSVIDGITYAMYGRHTRGNNENLVRDEMPSGSATVQFTVGSRRFVVERKLNSKGQLEGTVLQELVPAKAGGYDRKQLASGERRQFHESTADEVAKVVGLDYDSMRVAAIIQQGELAKIVDMQPKDTKDLINQLIGIDQLGAAHDAMPEVVSSFRDAVRGKYGYDDTDLSTLKTNVGEQESISTGSSSKLRTLTSELEGLRKEETALETQRNAMEPLRVQAERLQQLVETLVDYAKRERSKVEESEEELDAVITKATSYLSLVGEKDEQLRLDKASLAEQESENERLLTQLADEVAALDASKDRPEQLDRIIANGRASLGLVSREQGINLLVATAGSELSDLELQIAALNQEKGKYEGWMELASRLEFKGGVCPMCGSKVRKVNEPFDMKAISKHLGEHAGLVAPLLEKKNSVKKNRDEGVAETTKLVEAKRFLAENCIAGEEDISKLEKERKELLARLDGLPSLKGQKKERLKTRRALKNRSEELISLESAASVARAYLADHKIGSTKEVDALRRQKEGLKLTLSRVPTNVDALKVVRNPGKLAVLAIDEQSGEMLKQIESLAIEASKFDVIEHERISGALDRLRSVTIIAKSSECERCKSEKEGAEKQLETLRKGVDVGEKAAVYVKVLTLIRERVYHRDGPVSSSMRSWALNQIGLKASEYSRLFGIGVSSIVLKEKGREIVMECYRPRGIVKVDSLSGGEKVAVALALRFAMAYVMGGYKLDFVVLDEPTVYLDEERRRSMVEIISTLGGGSTTEASPLKQMIVITHDAEIFENANVDAVFRFESSPAGSIVKQALRQPTIQQTHE